MNFKTFFINLPTRHSCWKKARFVMSLAPEEISESLERVPAEDTRNDLFPLQRSGLSLNPVGLYNKLYFSQGKGAVGCFLSHYKCWQKIIDEKLNCALILEDDVVMSDVVNYLCSNPDIRDEDHLVHLGGRGFDGLEAYILTNSGAKRLISLVGNHSHFNNNIGARPIGFKDKNASDFRSFKSEEKWDWNYSNNISMPVDKFIGACTSSRFDSQKRLSVRFEPSVDLALNTSSFSGIYNKDTRDESSIKMFWNMNEQEIDNLIKSKEFEYWKKPEKITFCICTYDNHKVLFDCVSSLINQTLDARLYDILILDNTPQEKLKNNFSAKKVKIFCSAIANLEYIQMETDGLSGARNECIERCESELIHFLDDDTIVSQELALNTVNKFKSTPDIAVLGGKVEPEWGNLKKPVWFSDECLGFLSMIDFGDKDIILNENLSEPIWLVGANLCFKKSILISAGGFATNLGRKGGTRSLMGSEEAEVIAKILKTDYLVLYTPDCAVKHVIPESRLNQDWFLSRVSWQSVSDLMVSASWVDKSEDFTDFIRDNLDLLTSKPKSASTFSKKLKFFQYLSTYLLKN
jgi:glucosyl-dolichyl phosphate glucuronosyltransferase